MSIGTGKTGAAIFVKIISGAPGLLAERTFAESTARISRRQRTTRECRKVSRRPTPPPKRPANYRAVRGLGGDAVGMSTVPEVLAAATLGMKILGLSTITNVAHLDSPQVVTSEEVVEVAGIAQLKLRKILAGVLKTS